MPTDLDEVRTAAHLQEGRPLDVERAALSDGLDRHVARPDVATVPGRCQGQRNQHEPERAADPPGAQPVDGAHDEKRWAGRDSRCRHPWLPWFLSPFYIRMQGALEVKAP